MTGARQIEGSSPRDRDASLVAFSAYAELRTDKTITFIQELAERIAADYLDYSQPDDLAQEAWAWIGEHPVQCSRWWFIADDGRQKFAWRNFRLDISRVMREYAKKDRLSAVGLEEDDQVAYGRKQVERHLPYVWHSEILAAVGEADEGPRAKVDPALGGDSMVSAMDVRRGFSAVIDRGSDVHKALFCTYALGWTQSEIGDELSVSQQTVSRLVAKGVGLIVDYLSEPLLPGRTLDDGPRLRQPDLVKN